MSFTRIEGFHKYALVDGHVVESSREFSSEKVFFFFFSSPFSLAFCLIFFLLFVFSFNKLHLQMEELEQKHLHLLQVVESEKTAKWQYTQHCEELTEEIKKLRTEVSVKF